MKKPCEEWALACIDAAEDRPDESFQIHLESCERCRLALDELRDGIELLRPEPAPVPGPWLAKSIRQQAEARRQRPTRRLMMLAPMAAAAGVLLVLVTMSKTMTEPSVSDQTRGAMTQPFEEEVFVAHDDAGEMEAEISSYLWDDEWGVGVETLIGRADADELENLLASLPPSSSID